MLIKQIPSTNFGNRSATIDTIVIHNISLPPNKFGGNFIEDFFCNKLNYNSHPYFMHLKNLKVSSHLLIKRDGVILQFVPFNKKAWHAGKSNLLGRNNVNNFSIGIELEGADNIKYNNIQYDKLNEILKYLISIYNIKYIVGHSDIAPERKTDPGPYFIWQNLLNGKIDKYRKISKKN